MATNIRGYELNVGVKKRGPKTPATSRKTPLLQRVEMLERSIAAAIRASTHGWTNDEVEWAFYRGCQRHNCMSYYAARAGPNTKSMSSWRSKMFKRHGLKNATLRLVYKSRKNDESVYQGILKSWARFKALIDELVQGGAKREWIVLVNLDETGMRKNTGTGRAVVPAEQLAAGNHAGRVFETEVVSFSIGNVLTTHPGLHVVPMTVVHTKDRQQKEVFCMWL